MDLLQKFQISPRRHEDSEKTSEKTLWLSVSVVKTVCLTGAMQEVYFGLGVMVGVAVLGKNSRVGTGGAPTSKPSFGLKVK